MPVTPPHDPLAEYVVGYPKLAARMGLRPESAIFRNFGTLNARNLLYMQAELSELEVRLDKLTKQDSESKDFNKQQYATHFGILARASNHADQEQFELAMLIRVKLQHCNDALLQVHRLNEIMSPDKYDLHEMQRFLDSKDMGSLALQGHDAFYWGTVSQPKNCKPDLIALKEREKLDTFSKWIAERAMVIIKCFGRWRKSSSIHGQVVVYDSSILKATFWVTSIIASMIPVASIAVLMHLKTQAARLGAIAVFNAVISLCLNIFTEAKRTDCPSLQRMLKHLTSANSG